MIGHALTPANEPHPNEPGYEPRVPSNMEAEQALIGSILYDNAGFHLVEGVEGRHFHEPFHQRLWDLIADKIGKGVLAEPIMVAEAFGRDAAFVEMGGLVYLAELVDRAPPAANAPQYANHLKDLAQRRDLIRLGSEIGQGAHEAADAADVIGHAEASLLAMQASSRKLELTTAGTAASRVLDYLDAPADEVRGIRLGIEPLDEELGPLLAGNLVLFMGRPGMGKSAAAECVSLNIAQQGYGVIQINGEMTEEEMAQRHLSDVCQALYGFKGPKYQDIRRRKISYEQRQMLNRAFEQIHPLPLMMVKRAGLRFSQLRSLARRQAAAWARQGIPLGALVVDHMGLIRTDQQVRDRYEAQTIISNGTKELAEELGCPVIALNQMNRQNENRDDKRPQLSDLRDSGAWEQDADFVIGWFREAYYAQRQPAPKRELEEAEWLRAKSSRTVEAIILKARAGACSTVNLWGDVARNAIRGHAPEGDLFDE